MYSCLLGDFDFAVMNRHHDSHAQLSRYPLYRNWMSAGRERMGSFPEAVDAAASKAREIVVVQ